MKALEAQVAAAKAEGCAATIKKKGNQKKKKRLTPQGGLCFHCREPGHMANECPKKHLPEVTAYAEKDDGSFLNSVDVLSRDF